MVQSNAVSLFYASLAAHSKSTATRKGRKPGPMCGMSDKGCTKSEHAAKVKEREELLEQTWTLIANESHNLPRTFDDCTGAYNTLTLKLGASAKPGKSKTMHLTLGSAGTRTSRDKSRSGSPRNHVYAGPAALDGFPVDELLVHVFKFLSNHNLAASSLVSRGFAACVRPVVESRVEFRMRIVAELQLALETTESSIVDLPEAESMIRGVHRWHIEEIRQVNRCTEPIRKLGEAVSVCFNDKPASWKAFQLRAQDPTHFAAALSSYDTSTVTTKLLQRLKPYVSDPDLACDRIRKVFSPAAPVALWLHGVYGSGRFLFRPWASDRQHAIHLCQQYLAFPKLDLSVFSIPPLAQLEPLTSCDSFGLAV
ncbi:Dynein heavy chain [Diplonema papillatum]|nr:Dynein heavy chain [Diplonema papillatum]